MKNTWKRAAEDSAIMVAEISRHIKGYSYESAAASRKTEEAIFSLVNGGTQQIRDSIHLLMNLGFELHRDDLSETARTVIDRASSVEARASRPAEWGPTPFEFLKKLIMRDSVIVLGSAQLEAEAASLLDRFQLAVKDAKTYRKELPAMKKAVDGLLEGLENLADVLREREKLREIRTEYM